MSTRCLIGIQNKDESVELVYCHHDGYPEGVGKILLDHYSTDEDARSIIAGGDLSSLAERLGPAEGEKHSFDNPTDGVCVYYHRDRGEKWEDVKPRKFESLKDAIAYFYDSWCEYFYIIRPHYGEWECLPKVYWKDLFAMQKD